jgi:ABC-type multidrug transport system fused ATPase/permease subunit
MRILLNFFSLFENKIKFSLIIIFIQIIITSIIETLSIGFIIPLLIVILQNNIFEKFPILTDFFPILITLPKDTILKIVVLTFFLLFSIKTLLTTYFGWRQISFGTKIQSILSSRLYAMYLRMPYSHHLEINSSTIINNFNIEIPNVQAAINSFLNLLSELFIIIMITSLLIIYQPIGTSLVILFFILVASIYTFITNKYLANWSSIRQVQFNKSTQNLMQGLGSIKEIKLFGREEGFIKNFSQSQDGVHRITKLYNFSSFLPRQLMEYLSIICLLLLILFLVSVHASNQEILYTIGLFAMAAFRLIPSITRSITYAQSLKFSIVSIKKITSELDLEKFKNNITKTQFDETNFEVIEKIKINNLTFKFPTSNKLILKNISFEILKGQTIGIIGSTGSGKSTLIDILIGLLEPMEGGIEINEQKLSNDNLNSWKKHIGYVSQNIYLTDDSIKNNIAIGIDDDEIDVNKIRFCLHQAQLDDFINNLPDNINSFVGERGVRISGGQKQRIGIARALYHDPSILVLDEATSALDSNTENEIMNVISTLKDKTIIIIAHRISTLKNCDFIIKLEQGVITNFLKPNEL